MKNIAIIPARSGSKGLPHKNIKLLAGKPLMAWTIEAALESGMFDTVMVSTDSEEYAKIAREYGAEVPFLRSAETSTDTAGSWDVVAEVLENYKKLGQEFDNLMLLQPTSPIRSSEDIKGIFELLEEKNANAAVAVTEIEHCPLHYKNFTDGEFNYKPGGLSIYLALKDKYPLASLFTTRRQDMPVFHRVNGAMYLLKVSRFEESRHFYDANCYAYVMPSENSIDVDTELDFVIAEAVLKHFRGLN
jgi:CMP-N,N'-diacetyllegionaminic acid synthase